LNLPHVCFIAVHIYPVLAGHRGIAFVGGAEVQQSVQMRALLRAGCRISVLTKDHGQPDVVDCDGITVYKIPDSGQRGWPGLRFFHPRMSDLVSLLRRINPDIVFMQTAGEQVASAAVYARMAGKPFVFAGASDKDFVLGPLPGRTWRSWNCSSATSTATATSSRTATKSRRPSREPSTATCCGRPRSSP
jgi:hypothetical protein